MSLLSEPRWDGVQAELERTPAGQATQCCGEPQTGGAVQNAASGACCG